MPRPERGGVAILWIGIGAALLVALVALIWWLGLRGETLNAVAQEARWVRTIQVDAADSMRFTPSNVAVKQGETIRFVIRNSGKLPHEFSLGTEKTLKEHYALMKKFPTMEHEEPNQISLKPGQQGEVMRSGYDQATEDALLAKVCLLYTSDAADE